MVMAFLVWYSPLLSTSYDTGAHSVYSPLEGVEQEGGTKCLEQALMADSHHRLNRRFRDDAAKGGEDSIGFVRFFSGIGCFTLSLWSRCGILRPNRMLKKPLFSPAPPRRAETRLSPSFVLASLRGSTSLRPRWKTFLNILLASGSHLSHVVSGYEFRHD